MAFLTGSMLINAPASALNNLGKIEGSMTDNASGVKYIKTREGAFPYVSAQSFRYWLRETLENGNWGWITAPIFREDKIAYTAANPIKYWDDDLFGYMRAPGTGKEAKKSREVEEYKALTQLEKDSKGNEMAVTRVSPFRVSTFVSIAPVFLVNDFGVMSRHEGDPVPYEHQFYRADLQGLFSLDLKSVGTFSYKDKTGYLNLDSIRIGEAEVKGLTHLHEDKVYRLSDQERIQRISALLEALSALDGGAKQALHYTDVSPDLIIVAATRGGNHIFGHVITPDHKGKPIINAEALKEVFKVYDIDILSDVYMGWVKGYLDEERSRFLGLLDTDEELKTWKERIKVMHPREALKSMVEEMKQHSEWLE